MRMLHILIPSEEWAMEALDEISNPVLYRAIVAAGYDILKITDWRNN
jgi:hypothetical protein